MKTFTEGAQAASPLRASKILRVVGLIAPLGAVLTLSSAAGRLEAQQAKTATPNDAAVEARVDSLLKQMTADEKIGQLNQVFALSTGPTMEKRLRAGQLGSLLMLSDPALINKLQHAAVEGSRLHIPLLFGLDVIHGLRTIFPVPIGLAASWDPATVENAQAVAAKEARAVGVHWTFAPMVDIARDPRWGRIVEGAGEDPYLGSVMAAAQVRGFQGDYLGASDHIIACAKHFAGYGAAEGGRDYDASDISDDQLWNVYLPPFESAVRAGTGTLMSAYMDLNGVPATGNRWLLQDVLREQWHFKGFVVSDADAVKSLKTHGYAPDTEDAAVRAFLAGVNMEMALGNNAYAAGLPQALKAGRITEKELDETVRPILAAKIRLGLFEHPYVDETVAKAVIASPEHRVEARKAAQRSAVLLRNEADLLPLNPTIYKKIAVIGPLADSKTDTAGPWTFANDFNETVTVLSGLREEASAGTQIEYAQGVQIKRTIPSPFGSLRKEKTQGPWTDEQAKQEFTRALDLAKNDDVSILVLGEAQDMIGEAASRSSLDLPGKQEELLESVVATGKPIVLVLLTGRPLNITWANDHVPAILEAWYPGTQAGNAVADLLYGKAVPGGKLPFSWPRSVGQVPIFYAHNTTHAPANQGKRYWDEESTPLFPFGFGLSYAKFAFSNLQVSKPTFSTGEPVEVSVDVENTSDRPGEEVAQVYIHQQYGTSSRPVRELKGFRRLALGAHEKITLHFTLTKEELTYWSSATHSSIQDTSVFDVWAGSDSTATLHAGFTVAQ